jgi:hypothetical protein
MHSLFLEFETVLHHYLSAQPRSPVGSLDDILTMDIPATGGGAHNRSTWRPVHRVPWRHREAVQGRSRSATGDEPWTS